MSVSGSLIVKASSVSKTTISIGVYGFFSFSALTNLTPLLSKVSYFQVLYFPLEVLLQTLYSLALILWVKVNVLKPAENIGLIVIKQRVRDRIDLNIPLIV